jgi:hypothetical protein
MSLPNNFWSPTHKYLRLRCTSMVHP